MASPQIVIDLSNQKVNEGVGYTANYLENALASGGFARLHVKTGARESHVIINVEAEGKVYFRTFSSPTVTVQGTTPGTSPADKLTSFNRKSGVANGNITQVFHTPTFTGGLIRGNRMLPFGSGGNAQGGVVSGGIKSIFAPNQSYIIEVQNVSGQARDVGIVLDWYEVTL